MILGAIPCGLGDLVGSPQLISPQIHKVQVQNNGRYLGALQNKRTRNIAIPLLVDAGWDYRKTEKTHGSARF